MATKTESVKIIIGAQDRASSVLSGVDNAVTKVEGTIEGFGETMAASGVDAQSLLSAIGGPELADFGNQLVDLRGKLSEFNAANAKGAEGLAGMKAGLIAAAAVGGFKFGQWLSGATQQAEDFADSLTKSQDILNATFDVMDRRASREQFSLGLIDDEQAKIDRVKELIALQEKERQGAVLAQGAAKKEVQFQSERFDKFLTNLGVNSKMIEQSEREYETATASVEKYTDGIDKLREQLRQLQEVEKKRQNGLKEQAKIDAENEKRANADAAIDSLLAAADAEEEARNKQIDAGKNYLEGLQLQLVALRDGEEAAERMRAANAGLLQSDIDAGSELRKQITALKESKKENRGDNERSQRQKDLRVNEQRFLVRGRDNPQVKMVIALDKNNQQLEAVRELISGETDILKKIESNTKEEVEVVG